MTDAGPVQIPKGKIIGRRWKIVKKLGEGGCGAVYKVEDITRKGFMAALKAESNFVAGGSVLKLEVQILRRLEGKMHVAQLLHSGKKDTYSYMVMTLLGDSLNNVMRKIGKVSSVSTKQELASMCYLASSRFMILVSYMKPANVAIGRPDTPQYRFLHILDFGLAREFILLDDEGRPNMRRPRQRALFRGTTRYCSIATHERAEQGRVDDLRSTLYMLAEMRGSLPWSSTRDKKDVHEMKKSTDDDTLLENSPVQLVLYAQHLRTMSYYSRPDYQLLHSFLFQIMEAGEFKFSDPYDWEVRRHSEEAMDKTAVETGALAEQVATTPTATSVARTTSKEFQDDNPFPPEEFATNPIGFTIILTN